jgi:hypothetical protein
LRRVEGVRALDGSRRHVFNNHVLHPTNIEYRADWPRYLGM